MASGDSEVPLITLLSASLTMLLVLTILGAACGVCDRNRGKKKTRQKSKGRDQKTAVANNAIFREALGQGDEGNSTVPSPFPSQPGMTPLTPAVSLPNARSSEVGTYDYSQPIDVPINRSEDLDSYSYPRSSGLYLPPAKEEAAKEMASGSTRGKRNSAREDAGRQYQTPATENALLLDQILEIFKIEELKREVIKFGSTLGEGNFGKVIEGEFVNSKGILKKVAVKTVKEDATKDDKIKFLQEVAIMVQFKHPNVVRVHGVVTVDQPFMIILELLTNGDMANYLVKERMKSPMTIDKHTLLSFCRQVAAGMVYLSNKSFVHRDLAARNILLSQYGVCKIADFGLSRDLMDEQYYVSKGGKIPVKWTAPEALYYKKYSAASDIWSYGIVMFEVWSLGRKPYEGRGVQEIMRIIDMGYRLPPPSGCPRSIYEAMIGTWHPRTSERPMFEDLAEQLSMPDSMLLEWTEADGPPLALGDLDADMSNVFPDLQFLYSASSH